MGSRKPESEARRVVGVAFRGFVLELYELAQGNELRYEIRRSPGWRGVAAGQTMDDALQQLSAYPWWRAAPMAISADHRTAIRHAWKNKRSWEPSEYLPNDGAWGEILRANGPVDLDASGRRASCILVIDDEPTILDSTCTLLEEISYDAIAAASETEAWEQLSLRRVDCILADVRMPGFDLDRFLGRLRAMGATTPVLLFSASMDAMRLQQFHDIQGIVSKPFLVEELRRLIEQATNPTRRLDEGPGGDGLS